MRADPRLDDRATLSSYAEKLGNIGGRSPSVVPYGVVEALHGRTLTAWYPGGL